MKDFCYWSVGNGAYSHMLQTMVDSARAVGVEEDFHFYTDRPITGAVSHDLGGMDMRLFLFKLQLLAERVAQLDYKYFVFLDADTYFVQKPRPFLDIMQGSPIHCSLESDCSLPSVRQPHWWGCPIPRYVELMRQAGVKSDGVYNINAGFFIVERKAAKEVSRLAANFWLHSRNQGFAFTEEPPLAYAAHMLCKSPEQHRIEHSLDVWATDLMGAFRGELPERKRWPFLYYMTGRVRPVNPAIVHAIRSKSALVAAGGGPKVTQQVFEDQHRVLKGLPPSTKKQQAPPQLSL